MAPGRPARAWPPPVHNRTAAERLCARSHVRRLSTEQETTVLLFGSQRLFKNKKCVEARVHTRQPLTHSVLVSHNVIRPFLRRIVVLVESSSGCLLLVFFNSISYWNYTIRILWYRCHQTWISIAQMCPSVSDEQFSSSHERKSIFIVKFNFDIRIS